MKVIVRASPVMKPLSTVPPVTSTAESFFLTDLLKRFFALFFLSKTMSLMPDPSRVVFNTW